ncbi:VOC family protein [Nocardia camponoti]|uniref:VOC domain-containing protein n=1 Tax=Nocardia camponoti TaxID=1616106 RepID=A0A917QE03_9NOCA|nr:VOC family protein [Nocardia camponoti]GGK44269.1 hypothetical protein GCM10011591_14740 [Nocardia camponoti]
MSYQAKPGDPNWVDLYTSDPAGAAAFYGSLFGWSAESNEEFGGYIRFSKDGAAVAGGMGRREDDGDPYPDRWTIYLATNDAAATAKKAEADGGSIVLEPMVVGDLGTMTVLTDVGGVAVGAWQADQFPGFGAVGNVSGGVWRDAAGLPSWFELMTRDYEGSLKFYHDVFGWTDTLTIADTPEFKYTTIHATSPMVGGVMDGNGHLPEGVPGAWTVYFGSDNVDATVEQAVALGGSVVFEPMETPYGKLAGLADPSGAHFCVGGTATTS